MNSRTLGALAPIFLVTAAGLAQSPTDDTYQPRAAQPNVGRDAAQRSAQKASTGMLIKGRNIVGAKVMNKANEQLGKIDDILIETRNGDSVYGILAHGGVLGIGDKLIALPWNAMQILPTSDGDATVIVDTTTERLKNAPSFDKDQWPLIGEKDWMDRAYGYFGTQPSWNDSGTHGWGHDSTMTKDWSQGHSVDFKGRIDSIERRAPGNGMSEGVILTVQGDDRQQHTVVLGPSWFLQGQSATFKEGEEIEVHAREIRQGDGTMIVAREVVLNGGDRLELRDASGAPAWDAATVEHARADQHGTGTFVRASELSGKGVLGTGDNKVAEVKELAIDPSTGRVPYLILSVGGVVGVGSKEVVAPWQSFRFAKQGEKLALNADEATLKSAPQLDKGGFAMVNDPQFRERVAAYFGDGFGGRLMGSPESGHPGDPGAAGWRAGSEYNKFYTGESVSVSGTVAGMGHTPPMKGMSDAATLKIRTADGDKTVHLGPTWFVNRQEVRLNSGDQVTVKGCKATVQGEEVILASEVQTSSGTLHLRDGQGRPEWDAIRSAK